MARLIWLATRMVRLALTVTIIIIVLIVTVAPAVAVISPILDWLSWGSSAHEAVKYLALGYSALDVAVAVPARRRHCHVVVCRLTLVVM